jgi:hypothetical protein
MLLVRNPDSGFAETRLGDCSFPTHCSQKPDSGFAQKPDSGFAQKPDSGFAQKPDSGFAHYPTRDLVKSRLGVMLSNFRTRLGICEIPTRGSLLV